MIIMKDIWFQKRICKKVLLLGVLKSVNIPYRGQYRSAQKRVSSVLSSPSLFSISVNSCSMQTHGIFKVVI